jgi:ADP-ribose pyrophosphatase YjhB (NUDIX family)
MTAEYRDGRDKALTDYPRPSVAVDTAVLTYETDGGLLVLQVRRTTGAGWALPGTFLHPGETLARAVRRSLRDKANVDGIDPRQLHVFDRIGRDDRGWVLSVGHVAVVPLEQLAERDPDNTRLVPAATPGRLAFDHEDIIEMALTDLQSRYLDRPDPDRLLGETFTLRQLRQVHEAVDGAEIGPDKLDTFRRRMQERLIRVTGNPVRPEGRGRPAQRFRRC